MTAQQRASDDIAELLKVVTWLEDSYMPGTAKPWTPPTITDERRNQMDALARAERIERTDIAPGDSPDPYDFGVVDMLVDILSQITTLAARVAEIAGWNRIPPATSAYGDARPHLRYLGHLLADATHADPQVPSMVSAVCHPLITRSMQVLGLMADGQLLAGCCPWCGGRSSKTPTGGGHTLRVRTMPNGDAVLVCEGGMCEPPSADVGMWWRGLPAWPVSEWPWLADRIERADKAS